MSEMNNTKNLLQYSMHAGVWLGLYLIARFVCSVTSIYSPALNLLAMVLFIGTPVVLYYIMAQYHKTNTRTSSFSLLWMMGVMLFFFASLICAVPEYIFYEHINPDFVATTMKQSVELVKEMNLIEDAAMLQELEQMSSSSAVITSLQMVASSIWSNVFFGSLLSILVSLIVVRRKK